MLLFFLFNQTPPPNNDAINIARTVNLPDFHFITNDWLSGDVNRLRVGVKQKNIELLSEPIKKESVVVYVRTGYVLLFQHC